MKLLLLNNSEKPNWRDEQDNHIWTAYQTYPLQKVDPRKLDEKTEKVIDAIEHIKANDISETNNLLQAANT